MSAGPEGYQFAHEKLRVWQEARQMICAVYELTRKLPKAEAFGVVSQLNRASVSVACNLAEGSARTSSKDQAHFSQLAYSSLMEVSCLITVCEDLRFLIPGDTDSLKAQIALLSGQINRLRQTQIGRSSTPR